MITFLIALIFVPAMPRYEPDATRYRVDDIKIIDGDTIEADIHLPLKVLINDQRIRFLNVDTWEPKKEQRERGLAAKEFTKNILSDQEVWIVIHPTKQHDSFGRVLAEIWVYNGNRWIDVAYQLKKHGHEKKVNNNE